MRRLSWLLLILLALTPWVLEVWAQHSPPLPIASLGGDGSDGDFTYAGEGAAACSGSICNGGTCSGTTPNGTCTLSLNSYVNRVDTDAGAGFVSVVRNYSSFTRTAGTVTVATTITGVEGASLILRVLGDVNISGLGTAIDMKGRGTKGATAGACSSSNAGKAGGSTSVLTGGAAGASGNNPGGVGVSSLFGWNFPSMAWINLMGTGGGTCPASGGAAPRNISVWAPSFGASGGGGGGCAASCSGTCGAGGSGGGMVRIEAGGTYTCTDATIDVRGNDGTTGGGGGGGGGVHVLNSVYGNDTCTISNTGGAAGATPPTNCGAGAVGGTGVYIVATVPK